MKTYLEYKDEKSHKFWEIEIKENSHTVRYGKVGTNGRVSTKEFETEEKAQKDAEKLINSKKKKGYLEGGQNSESGKNQKVKEEKNFEIDFDEKIKSNPKGKFMDCETAYKKYKFYFDANEEDDEMWANAFKKVLVFEGDLYIKGNFFEGKHYKQILKENGINNNHELDLFIVDGDLIVEYDIPGRFCDEHLFVSGKIKCNVLESCERIQSNGAEIKYVFYSDCYDDYGCTSVKGEVDVPYLICDSDEPIPDIIPSENTTTVCLFGSDLFFDYIEEDLEKYLLKSIKEPTDWIKIVKAGKSPFKKNAKPSKPKRVKSRKKAFEKLVKNIAQSKDKSLELSGEDFSKIPDIVIDKVKDLEHLKLSVFSNPRVLNDVKNFKKLKSIDLCYCDFENTDALTELENLEELSLSSSYFYFYQNRPKPVLPTEIERLKNLQKLHIEGIDLSNIENIQKVPLKELKISDQKEQIDLYNFTLEKLVLSYVNINLEKLGELTNLKHLEIENSVLVNGLPVSFLDLQHIEYLSLRGCKLDTNPEILKGLAKFKNLKHLDLQKNNLRELPEEFFTFENLEYLDLEDNKLPKEVCLRLEETYPNAEIKYWKLGGW